MRSSYHRQNRPVTARSRFQRGIRQMSIARVKQAPETVVFARLTGFGAIGLIAAMSAALKLL